MLHRLIILCFLFTFTAAVDDPNHISINCGGAAALSGGRRWSGDAAPKGKASSTASTVSVKGKLIAAVDPVPYETARISRSQFSYSFQLDPGQKFIRLHFNPASYHGGFQAFNDFFTVEAGPFTLLANFSASITASALSLDVIVKEFCIITQENEPLNIVFSPEIARSDYNYAFINGIEIISVPSTLSYCHGGDSGVQVLGQKSLIYVDNTAALERVYYHNIKWDSLSFGSDIGGMFGIWASKLQENVTNLRWRVPVDVGFSYLVRIHLGSKMDFKLLINGMIALTGAHDHELIQQGGNGNQTILWYNCMVMVEGHKREGKRSISISLHSQHQHAAPIEGFEVFKLSNHDRSLASPNPRQPRGDSSSSSLSVQTLLYALLGRGNAIATVVFAVICLVNIIVHLLHKIKMWGAGNDNDIAITEEENEPSARAKRVCRCFSLAEIQSATENFNGAFILGKGGFGKVYRGLIDNGREIVAIKRSKPDFMQGGLQFWTEVETLSELRHVNLVSLIGYCIEQREMIIVYEYMPYGSLADHLYKLARKSNNFYPLSWKQRLEICIGASRALDYLHTGHGIIHRDVKASNILLDEKLVAKVSDFGLAKTGTGSESQSQDSTNLKGTFGYIDPNYFRTRKLTKKSDTYSFGVVLLEVLCGRPAVEPWNEEDMRSLTMWAIDNISKGQVDLIVAPSLRGEISTDSLNTFVKVADRCLHDEPKKRPTMTHIIIKLELALRQQEKAESFSPKEMTGVEDVSSSIEKSQQENMNFLVPNEEINATDALNQKENVRSSTHDEIRNATDVMPCTDNDRNIFSVNTRPMTSSFNVKTDTSLLREQSNSTMINSGRKDGRKSMLRRISQKLWPRDAFWKTRKPSNKTSWLGISVSALLSRKTSNITLGGNTISNERTDGMSSAPSLRISSMVCEAGDDASGSPGPAGQMLPQPNLRLFSLLELKAATRNFRHDSVLGEGGFGKVYKGLLDTKPSASGSGTQVAVKKLHSESMQGFQEWQSEVNFLGRLSHPNLVKLLGYGYEEKELLLVYEFMPKGSLENHLFGRGASVNPLRWNTRLKILIGAANGLAFLHSLDSQVIYRDFKASNILLDGFYHAKISDFGLAKLGPTESYSHVSTQVMGTYGYAAPEYIATGHLYVKSDVYGFGVVLVEMLTGQRALDNNRPSGQHYLVDWIKPHLSERRKLKHIMDVRLEGRYPKSVLQIAQLALNCLESEPKNRPSMQLIVETLERIRSSNDRPRERKAHSSPQAAKRHPHQPLQYRSPLHPMNETTQAYPLPPRA